MHKHVSVGCGLREFFGVSLKDTICYIAGCAIRLCAANPGLARERWCGLPDSPGGRHDDDARAAHAPLLL